MASISETHIENRERIQPDDTNNYGTAHGGNIVKWMDEVGAMSAMRHAGESCVTVHVDGFNFKRPVPQGDTCLIESYAYETGQTSIRVRLQVYREYPRTGEREQTTETHFVFVAIDENNTPVDVPDLAVESDRCRQLRDEALNRESDD